jgi:hypothetical protein
MLNANISSFSASRDVVINGRLVSRFMGPFAHCYVWCTFGDRNGYISCVACQLANSLGSHCYWFADHII